MNIRDVLLQHERAVAIVHYRLNGPANADLYHGGPPIQNPAILLQVSLLASKVSRSGELIRLGDTLGDEITGWTKLDALEVVEILGTLDRDGKTVTPLVPRETSVSSH